MKNLFLILLNISLSASVVALFVILLRAVFRKAPRGLICGLWLLVALRLLIPVFPESSFSLIPKQLGDGSIVREISGETVEKPDQKVVSQNSPYQEPFWTQYNASGNRTDPLPEQPGQVSSAEKQPATQNPVTEPGKTKVEILTVLSAVWLVGAGLMLLYTVFSYLHIWKRTRTAVWQGDNVFLCEAAASPFLFGLFRPRIYLPFGMKEEARECVLAHEKAHIRRMDPFWKLLGFLLLALHWFNPILWLSFALFSRDIERACDERVIRNASLEYRKTYSATLLSVGASSRSLRACPLAFGGLSVMSRIRAVLNYRKPSFWLICLLAVGMIVVSAGALTNPKGNDGEQIPAESVPESTEEHRIPSDDANSLPDETEAKPSRNSDETGIIDPATATPERIMVGATHIINARYVGKVIYETNGYKRYEYVFEPEQMLKGTLEDCDRERIYVLPYGDSSLVDEEAPFSQGELYMMCLAKQIAVFYEHNWYCLLHTWTVSEKDGEWQEMQSKAQEISKTSDNGVDYYGTPFTTSKDVKEIADFATAIFVVRIDSVMAESNIQPTTVYYCTVTKKVRNTPNNGGEISITFPNSMVQVGEEYLVLLMELSESSKVYALAARENAVFSLDEVAENTVIAELYAQAEEYIASESGTTAPDP